MPRQYVRTCKSCGNVWYSLVSREEELKSKKRGYNIDVCCRTFNILDCGGRAKSQQNRDSVADQLFYLQKCPKCGSSNFDQRIEKFKG